MDVVGNRTVRDLWHDLVRCSGERTFLIFEDRRGRLARYTYAQFGAEIGRAANLLRAVGVSQGDAVVVHMRNCPELLMCLFALGALGAIGVPVHPRSTPGECADIVARVRADVVVCEPETLGRYAPGVDRIPVRCLLIAGGGPDAGGAPGAAASDGDGLMLDFEAARDAQPANLDNPPELSSDDPVAVVFTSGSTAQPKGVLLTHANLVFSGIFVDWQASLAPADRLLTTMPACHVNFLLNALMPVLTAGATLVVIEKYSAKQFWHQVCRHQATVVQSIAMILRTMLLQPVADWEKNHQVREMLYYLPVSNDEKNRFEERFAVRILNSYGTSETLVGVITDPPHGERRWPSIGRVALGYEARIVDDAGAPVGADTPGEIQVRGVRGRTVMKEYLNAPEATAALFDPDGWIRTGDIGYVDRDGWWYFLDRRSQFIKRAGENISPAEVEAVLCGHPKIAEAAVIGIPDPIYDEAVKAFVVPRHPDLTAAGVQEYCRAHLAEFKVPAVVQIVDELPRTRSFKVAKSSLT